MHRNFEAQCDRKLSAGGSLPSIHFASRRKWQESSAAVWPWHQRMGPHYPRNDTFPSFHPYFANTFNQPQITLSNLHILHAYVMENHFGVYSTKSEPIPSNLIFNFHPPLPTCHHFFASSIVCDTILGKASFRG